MKLHYFNQPAADTDDAVLRQAIADQIVPATCLVGGRIIAAARRVEQSPCDNCNGPRERCGGTPLATNATGLGNKAVQDTIRELLTRKPNPM